MSQSNRSDEGMLLRKWGFFPPKSKECLKSHKHAGYALHRELFYIALYIFQYPMLPIRTSILRSVCCAYSAHFSAIRAFWIDSRHIVCVHLMLSLQSCCEACHSPGGIIISPPGPGSFHFAFKEIAVDFSTMDSRQLFITAAAGARSS